MSVAYAITRIPHAAHMKWLLDYNYGVEELLT